MKSKILFLTLLPVFSVNAATVANWQFDDGTSGTASTLVSENNSPTVNGTAGSVAGGLVPTFNSATPGNVITNGVGGTVLNASNTSSLLFDNGPGGVFANNTSVGGVVSAPGASFQAASFTIEGFINVNNFTQFSTIFGKVRSDGGVSWQLDTDGSGKLRGRFDSQPLNTPSPMSGVTQGYNQNFSTTGNIDDNQWHHIALTYNGANRSARIFLDYTDVGGGTTSLALVYTGSNLVIGGSGGGRAFDGFIDEVRYTDSVLASSDFLRAVPEPSSALFVIATACLSLLVRKRY